LNIDEKTPKDEIAGRLTVETLEEVKKLLIEQRG
jgi:hypothetical protein